MRPRISIRGCVRLSVGPSVLSKVESQFLEKSGGDDKHPRVQQIRPRVNFRLLNTFRHFINTFFDFFSTRFTDFRLFYESVTDQRTNGWTHPVMEMRGASKNAPALHHHMSFSCLGFSLVSVNQFCKTIDES